MARTFVASAAVSEREGLEKSVHKMRAEGVADLAIRNFTHYYEQLVAGEEGLLPESSIEPVSEVPDASDLPDGGQAARDALDRTVVLKLNGGLGTSMGMTRAKSLLEAKDGLSFLDIIDRQLAALRERHGVRLPLVLMNTEATRAATPGFEDFLQSREPKLLADTHGPATWPADPALEWCPPGHGDIYAALVASRTLDRLLADGHRWAFIANADNLGAVADPRIAAWVVGQEVPFAMEVVRGTAADRKGGHLATLDGRLVLRETAQVLAGDASFADVERWRWYNTNDLWVDLAALREQQAAGLDLPLIVNRKTVDPADAASPAVLQLETAMGAAVGAVDGARAVAVPRTRFAPVKTTEDLLVLRSDAWSLLPDGRLEAAFDGSPPVVSLPAPFRALRDFEARFASGPLSLRRCRSLEVRGDVRFGAGVVVEGDVVVEGPAAIPDGAVLRG